MERFDYIIVTSDNKWESIGKQSTDDELAQDLKDIKERLKEEGRDEDLIVFSAPLMKSV